MPRKEDIFWGLRVGLIIGGLYAGGVLLLFALGGSGRFERLNISLPVLVAVYLLGGLSAGIVLGVFRPALREKYSAFIVSVLAAMPISFGITMLVTGKARDWTIEEWSTAAFMSLFIAAVGIAVLWQDSESSG